MTTIPKRFAFDLSDVHNSAIVVDRLDAVLEIATEVVGECAPDPGQTRLERMARWLCYNLGGEPYCPAEKAGSITRFHCGNYSVWVCGDKIGLGHGGDTDSVRPVERQETFAIAVALLRSLEMVGDEELAARDTEPELK